MSKESALKHLKKYKMESRVINASSSSATVSEAAKALGTTEERIAKTLSFKLKDRAILVVICGTSKIDNAKFKQTFGEKAHMLSHEEVEPITGHPVGGVCPFGVKEGVEIYLDVSLKKFATVYPACGDTNNAIELSITELENITGYIKWVDISKEN